MSNKHDWSEQVFYSIGFVIALICMTTATYFLWDWFIVPLGAQHLTIFNAVGLVVIINFLKVIFTGNLEFEEYFGEQIIASALALLSGLFFHWMWRFNC